MKRLALATKVAYLSQLETYSDATQVEALETHMSWLFLTDRLVYKLKKPIRYEQLDFSTLNLRRYYCEEEVRLNRRLAETVYLGTLALTQQADGELALDGIGQTVDWLVVMRRLPAQQMLDSIIARRVVEKQDVQVISQRLADFFASAPRVSISTTEFCQRLEEGIQSDRRELLRPEYKLNRNKVKASASRQLAFLAGHRALFEERIRAARIIDGHGDLRPEHICLMPDPVIIDCLEFCQQLREVDPADELAFIALECERLGQPRVGQWFIDAYQERVGELIPSPLLDFYRNYRILRRAKIAAWHLNDPQGRDRERYGARARHYLELATALPLSE